MKAKHYEGEYIPFDRREYTPMPMGEFIDKIMERDERDFNGIGLYSEDKSPMIRLNQHERFEELKRYLEGITEEEFEDEPIQLNDARLSGLIAPELKVPYIQAMHSILDYGAINKGDISRGLFYGTQMRYFTAEESDATQGRLIKVNGYSSNWRNGVLNKADPEGSSFRNADFRETERNGFDVGAAEDITDADFGGEEPEILEIRNRGYLS
ncbi:MAG: hypothetical protein SVV03_04020 [Candidatus Nanohaloarchaea archaeon]|nr:hypothetical protein [Candidatus Nanohaloarchaea archaeon]